METAKSVIKWLYSHTDFYMDGRVCNYEGPSEYLPNRFQLFENIDEDVRIENTNGIYESIHKHENLEMIYLIDGSIDKIYINGNYYSMHPGDIAIADSGVYHGIIERNRATMITCIYDTDFIKSMGINIENYSFTPIVNEKSADFIPKKMYYEMKHTPLYYYRNIQHLAKELIIKLVRDFSVLRPEHTAAPKNSGAELAKETVKYLQTEYAKNVTLKKIANHMGYSEAYISRVFKQITGRTLWFYLNYIRCEHAKWLLKTTHFPVETVAEKCGFSSEGYMTKVLKSYTDFTPSEIREAANADR